MEAGHDFSGVCLFNALKCGHEALELASGNGHPTDPNRRIIAATGDEMGACPSPSHATLPGHPNPQPILARQPVTKGQ